MSTTPPAPAPGEQLPPPPPPDPAVATMQRELARHKAELERMRGIVMTPAPPPVNPAAAADQHKELVKEFQKDPVSMTAAIADRAVKEHLARANNPGIETQVEMAKQLARGNDPLSQSRWDKYYGEVEARMATVDPQFRTNTTFWKSAFNMVLGDHVNDLINEARSAPPAGPAIHVREGGGPASPTKAAPAASGGEKLTPEEQKVARKFHLTEAQYLEGKRANLEQSDIHTDPVGPSSWDRYVTFDSRDKRRAEREARKRATTNAPTK